MILLHANSKGADQPALFMLPGSAPFLLAIAQFATWKIAIFYLIFEAE